MNNEFYDYIKHFGVLGMKWGVRKDRKKIKSGSSSSDKKQEARVNVKRAQMKEYRDDRGPKRFKAINAANSAARSHFKADRTNSFKTYRAQTSKRDIKEARLTEDQIKNGRYRVARARSIKRNAASAVLGTAAGAAAVASGAVIVAPFLAVSVSGIGHFASGAHYYARQRKSYGGTRAKYQNQKKR